MLSKNEFLVMREIMLNRAGTVTQRKIAENTGLSLGTVNSTMNNLRRRNLLNDNVLTDCGISELDYHKVDNAIIMAAGMSTRFAPLSYEKPKGMFQVKGDILIEREIKQLLDAGITDITVVVGYMKEYFFYLEDKYDVKIVINEDYYRYNNTSTLMLCLDELKNTYICSSDNYFEHNVFEPYVYKAYYSAVYQAGNTDEYCISFNNRNLITDVSIGGCDSWIMLGHAYFDRNYSNTFKALLVREYEKPEVKNSLWEKLYVQHLDEFEMYIRKYSSKEIFEFDSLDELRLVDPEYINNTNSGIMDNICSILKCEHKDITNINCIRDGLTNKSFYFDCNGSSYVYRHPGAGTDEYINRANEAKTMEIISKLGLDDTFMHIDESEGWKISRYVRNARILDYHNRDEVAGALDMMKTLHDANVSVDYDFDIWASSVEFVNKLTAINKCDFADFSEIYSGMQEVHRYASADNVQKCLCHCDCYSPNFLLDEDGNMYLIDWEYSGADDPANDLGTFICCSDYDYDEAQQILQMYYGRELTAEEHRHCIAYIAIAAFYWWVWALYQNSLGKDVGHYLYLWYRMTKFYMKKALEEYEEE